MHRNCRARMPAAATERGAAREARGRRLRDLYAVTPDLGDTARLCASVASALAGGASAVQYRNKSATAARRAEQASALAALCRSRGALFIVNDDAQLALAVDADGVHLGEDDAELRTARAIVGDDRLIGVSCYNDIERARALAPDADYLAFGSLYASTVKPAARHAPLQLLAEARALRRMIVGIGGIDAGNAAEVIRAGADAVAVINAVFASDDVERAARRIAAACAQAREA